MRTNQTLVKFLVVTNPLTVAGLILLLAFSALFALTAVLATGFALASLFLVGIAVSAHDLLREKLNYRRRTTTPAVQATGIVVAVPQQKEKVFTPIEEPVTHTPRKRLAPVMAQSVAQDNAVRKTKTSRRPSKKALATMPIADLVALAKDMGCKGVSTRLKRETILLKMTVNQ